MFFHRLVKHGPSWAQQSHTTISNKAIQNVRNPWPVFIYWGSNPWPVAKDVSERLPLNLVVALQVDIPPWNLHDFWGSFCLLCFNLVSPWAQRQHGSIFLKKPKLHVRMSGHNQPSLWITHWGHHVWRPATAQRQLQLGPNSALSHKWLVTYSSYTTIINNPPG